MRKIILLALFTILYTVQLGAQETQTQDTLSYKSFAEFNSDTVRFLEYNFTTRRKQYGGKKVSEVIKDMEFPITHVVEYAMSITDNSRLSKLSRLSLGIRRAGNQADSGLDYYVEVWFKNQPLSVDFKKVFNIYDPARKFEFTPELYNFIKDMEVSSIRANPYNYKIRKIYNME
jgi:hypothetical protein